MVPPIRYPLLKIIVLGLFSLHDLSQCARFTVICSKLTPLHYSYDYLEKPGSSQGTHMMWLALKDRLSTSAYAYRWNSTVGFPPYFVGCCRNLLDMSSFNQGSKNQLFRFRLGRVRTGTELAGPKPRRESLVFMWERRLRSLSVDLADFLLKSV